MKLVFVKEETYLEDAGLNYADFPSIEKGRFNDAKLVLVESQPDRILNFLGTVKGTESK